MSVAFGQIDGRTLRIWDGLVIFWVVFWVVLAGWTGLLIWQTADTGDTISTSGHSLHSVGQSLVDLSELPLVPDRPGEVGHEVVSSADQITQRGQEIKNQLHRLALLLGISILGVALTPVAGFYLPLRLHRHREVVRVRAELDRRPDDEGLDRYLAERARRWMPYDDIVRLVADPADPNADAAAVRRLADAELARLSVRRPSSA